MTDSKTAPPWAAVVGSKHMQLSLSLSECNARPRRKKAFHMVRKTGPVRCCTSDVSDPTTNFPQLQRFFDMQGTCKGGAACTSGVRYVCKLSASGMHGLEKSEQNVILHSLAISKHCASRLKSTGKRGARYPELASLKCHGGPKKISNVTS